jgi:hypothetical protein
MPVAFKVFAYLMIGAATVGLCFAYGRAVKPYYDVEHPLGRGYHYGTDKDGKEFVKKWPGNIPWPGLATGVLMMAGAGMLIWALTIVVFG